MLFASCTTLRDKQAAECNTLLPQRRIHGCKISAVSRATQMFSSKIRGPRSKSGYLLILSKLNFLLHTRYRPIFT